MSSKRINASSTKAKGNKAKSRKVEYDDEDISSEQESEVDDSLDAADATLAVDGDADTGTKTGGVGLVVEEDPAEDISNIPELHAPEVPCFFSPSFSRSLSLLLPLPPPSRPTRIVHYGVHREPTIAKF